ISGTQGEIKKTLKTEISNICIDLEKLLDLGEDVMSQELDNQISNCIEELDKGFDSRNSVLSIRLAKKLLTELSGQQSLADEINELLNSLKPRLGQVEKACGMFLAIESQSEKYVSEKLGSDPPKASSPPKMTKKPSQLSMLLSPLSPLS